MRAVVAFALLAACGGHRHGPAEHASDRDRLYVEITAEGSNKRALRDGAAAGLASVSFVVPVRGGGDIELQLEASSLAVVGNQTTCSVKILVMRLPQHDLLGIADGSARAGGTDGQAEADCLSGLGATLVRGKVRTLLRRRLEAKR